MNGGKLTLENDSLQAVIIELNGSGQRYGHKDDDIDFLLRDFGFKPFTYDLFSRELIGLDNYTSHNTIYVRDFLQVMEKLKKGSSVKLSNGFII